MKLHFFYAYSNKNEVIAIVKYLVEHGGADINKTNKYGNFLQVEA